MLDPATRIEVFGPAVAAAHRVLRRRDKEDVPAHLSKVAASAARTLPPPLATAVLAALDDDADLRAKALDELGAGPEVTAARAYLARPEGWEEIVAEVVAEVEAAGREREVTRLGAELSKMTDRRDAERQKAAVLAARLDEAEAKVADERSRRAAAVDTATKAIAADLAATRRRLAEVQAALAAAEEREARVLERLERARRDVESRRAPEAPVVRPTGGWAGDPKALARHADEVFEAAKARVAVPAEASSATPIETEAAVLKLPPGVRPDSADAVTAVLGWRAHILIDGYNLAGAFGALGDPSTARAKVGQVVDRMRAGATARVSVVFDSAEGEGDRPGERYVPDADEELRRLAAQAPATTVVVSDDREVIEGVYAAGATALWSAAVVEWASR